MKLKYWKSRLLVVNVSTMLTSFLNGFIVKLVNFLISDKFWLRPLFLQRPIFCSDIYYIRCALMKRSYLVMLVTRNS
jgi:hypothetical protein